MSEITSITSIKAIHFMFLFLADHTKSIILCYSGRWTDD